MARVAPSRYAPQFDWPSPTGSFAVGIREATLLDDRASGDKELSDKKPNMASRELALRVWYPATDIKRQARRPLMNEREQQALIPGMKKVLLPIR